MSTDTKARIYRLVQNGIVLVGAAALTALFQYLTTIDFGSWTGIVSLLSAAGIKTVQVWVEPAPEIQK